MTNSRTESNLTFDDQQCQWPSTMAQLNAMRKNRQFCDIVLSIDKQEITAHRAILACCSSFFFEMFNQREATSAVMNVSLEGVTPRALEVLVKYCYTGRIDVGSDKVAEVYAAAKKLHMSRVKKACGDYLASHLNNNNCIGLRKFAAELNDTDLLAVADDYINKNMMEVALSKEFLALPRLQVEIVGTDESESVSDRHLFDKVVDWVKRSLNEGELMKFMTEQVHALFLTSDNTLVNIAEVEDCDLEIIQEYQLNGNKQTTPNKRKSNGYSQNNNSQTARQLIMSPDDSSKKKCTDWKVISSSETSENKTMYIALSVLNDELVALSLHQKTPKRASSPRFQRSISVESQGSWTMLASMAFARCALGTAELDGKLVAAGGYNRGKCMDTVEIYDPDTNEWSSLPDMPTPRGRFEFNVIHGKLYAFGGSDGTSELKTGHCFDPDTGKWSAVAGIQTERHSSGAAVLDDKLYLAGGSSGSIGLTTCEVYNPETDSWQSIANLNHGRSQVGLCALGGKLYAVGGAESWNVLNSVEKYDPQIDAWTMVAPMNHARRGAGVCKCKDKLYIVGGSDGTSSLASVECFDPQTNTWNQVASMSTPRANMGVAVVDGHLYAVGGFDGKTFLNSIEYYDPETNQWNQFLPRQESNSRPDTPV
ncbi:influenza virus NS1A-binding protein homolog [Ptychodera flava]|uniref:influenza virus NS1A-binding protein homolog n=1 Tax=Ptychodera flava TaxID=63121 RepID=UPI00396A11DC